MSKNSIYEGEKALAAIHGQKFFITRTLYFFYFSAFGVIVTFLNIYYHDIGLNGVQIGSLAAVTPVVSMVAAPLWGMWSDRIGGIKPLLILACLGIILSVGGIPFVGMFVWLFPLTFAFSFFDSSILPMMDSNTLRLLGSNRDRYGRERMWGSIGFIISVTGIGYLLNTFGSQWLFLAYVILIAIVAVIALWLPRQRVTLKKSVYRNISQLIRKKEWLLFSASLIAYGIGSVALNGFLGIYIKELGGNEGLVGLSAALAAITELPILFLGPSILKRLGPRRLLIVAFAANSLRLFFYAIMPEAWWVIPISLLHSLSFGGYWIATVAYTDFLAPDEIKSSAQGILYAVLNISRLLGSLASGFLYDYFDGSRLFYVVALFSLLSIALTWINKPVRSTGGSL